MYKKNRNKQLAFEHFDQPLGLKLNPDALLQQVRLQFRKMGIGFPFHLKLFTETVFYGYQIKFGFIVIRKLMGFIYQ